MPAKESRYVPEDSKEDYRCNDLGAGGVKTGATESRVSPLCQVILPTETPAGVQEVPPYTAGVEHCVNYDVSKIFDGLQKHWD